MNTASGVCIPEGKAFTVVAETPDFILVDKSPGINFHSEDGELGLLALVKQSLGLSELYPVHRLDKMTSGLVVFAKTTSVNRELSMQFEARQVEKYYLALSLRKPKKKQGLIKGDMERSRRGSWKLLPSKNNPAVTQFFSQGVSGLSSPAMESSFNLRLFLLKPYTGKTHQLRVALKSLGAPICGDPLYGASDDKDKMNNDASTPVFERGYLHSYCLGFQLSGQRYRYLCPPTSGQWFNAEAVQQAIAGYAEPWALNWPALPVTRP